MKRISLKWKLTILYTLLMTLLTGLVLAVLLSLGSGRLLASAQAALRQRVVESFDLLESREGNLTVDSDFSDREGGIYLSAYDEDGLLLAGRVPYGFASAIDFQEDTVQTAELNGIMRKAPGWKKTDIGIRFKYAGKVRGFVRTGTTAGTTDAEQAGTTE